MKRADSVRFAFMNFPFVCFIAFLGVLYIANTHRAEKNMLKAQGLKKEIKEVKWQYLDMQQQIMFGSTQTQLKGRLKGEALKENRSVPQVILAEKS